jgi:hypothetical protein
MKQRFNLHTTVMLLCALALRLLAWRTLPYRDWISDEAEYWGAATWLAQGRGFQFFDGWVWSRPPLYLGFLAAHIKLFGTTALWAPRLSQAGLSVLAVWLVLRIGRRLAPSGRESQVGYAAAWAMALSYSFATFAFLLLSETVFLVLFLGGVLALIRWGQRPESTVDSGAAGSLLARLRQHPEGPRSGDLILAGLLLGAAALTRAIILTWLPLAALWLLFQADRGGGPWARSLRRRLIAGLLPVAILTGSVCAVVLPWSAYATARWGGGAGLILVDTTGGYNFAFGALKSLPKDSPEGLSDENDLHDLLCGGVACDGAQAARQSAAYALGWRLIRTYPGGFALKTGRELLDMVQLRYSGAERMRGGYTAGAVPAPHLIGLLEDDTLYMLALPLALLGMFRQQGRRGKGLVLSWLIYNVVIGALVFAINRFRQPLLPFLFIYAACGVVQWRESWAAIWRRRAAWAAVGLALALVLPTYLYWPKFIDADRRSSWQDTLLGFAGLRSAAECAEIESVLASGDVARARTLHDDADARYRPTGQEDGLDCLALINARLLQAEGRTEDALKFMVSSRPKGKDDEQAARILMLEADLLRRLGRTEKALGSFAAREVELINDTAWAWDNLDPPPTSTLDIGTGLDYGYVRGFDKREAWQTAESFRWAGAESAIRFPQAGSGQPQVLRLRVNGYTNDWRPTVVAPRVAGQALPAITLRDGWQTVEIALPPTPAGADVVVAFHSSVFVIGPQDLAQRVRDRTSQPLRLVGFQLDWAEVAGR